MLANREQYISGQKLSEELGCTRAAVWKQMEELRKDGYIFQAKARCGYKLVQVPNLLTKNEISPLLKTQQFGKEIYCYERVDSTQVVANQLATEGAPEGTIVLADFQDAGRGRLGRKWSSDHTKGIAMTLILRPQVPLQKISELTLVIAVALVRAIERTTELKAEIKWPNDIYLHGKKLCGVLTELKGEADRLNYILVGMGINVNEVNEDFGEELSKVATSLKLEGKKEIQRAALLADLLYELEMIYPLYLKEGFSPVKEIWEQHCLLNQKQIIGKTSQGLLTGKYKGITDEGILLLEDENGKIHQIISGDIVVKS